MRMINGSDLYRSSRCIMDSTWGCSKEELKSVGINVKGLMIVRYNLGCPRLERRISGFVQPRDAGFLVNVWISNSFWQCLHSSFSKSGSFWKRFQNCIRANKFSKNVTSNRTWTLDPRTVVFTVPCLSSCANSQVLIEGYLTLLVLMQLT